MLLQGRLSIIAFTVIGSAALLCAAGGSNFTYLALGDSVAFGLNPTLLTQPPPPPSIFTGYPEVVASWEHLLNSKKEVNAACPGETSGSFVAAGVLDYGCNSPGPQGQPPFKSWVGLHTNYPGTQLEFAVSTLTSDKQINLITLGIGSNDVLLLLSQCGTDPNPTACVNTQLPVVLQTYAANLTRILTEIRAAPYRGQLVLVGYYAPSTDLIPIAQALNATMLAVGAQFQTIYADGFTAFQLVATPYGGDVCKAGLLVRLSPTTCDIHPSPLGRDVLAATVLAAKSGVKVR
jgi:lysophospholipase L1-like esterase